MYKKVSKIIRYKQKDGQNDKSSNNIGLIFDKNPKKESKQSKNIIISNQDSKFMKPNIFNNKNQQMVIPIKQVKEEFRKKQFSDKQINFTDHQQLIRSSYKKKIENIKISMPKKFKPEETIQALQNKLLSSFKSKNQIINMEQVFQLPLLKQILGETPEQHRKVIYHPKINNKNNIKKQNVQTKFVNSDFSGRNQFKNQYQHDKIYRDINKNFRQNYQNKLHNDGPNNYEDSSDQQDYQLNYLNFKHMGFHEPQQVSMPYKHSKNQQLYQRKYQNDANQYGYFYPPMNQQQTIIFPNRIPNGQQTNFIQSNYFNQKINKGDKGKNISFQQFLADN